MKNSTSTISIIYEKLHYIVLLVLYMKNSTSTVSIIYEKLVHACSILNDFPKQYNNNYDVHSIRSSVQSHQSSLFSMNIIKEKS